MNIGLLNMSILPMIMSMWCLSEMDDICENYAIFASSKGKTLR